MPGGEFGVALQRRARRFRRTFRHLPCEFGHAMQVERGRVELALHAHDQESRRIDCTPAAIHAAASRKSADP
jgi:hypothetical protein